MANPGVPGTPGVAVLDEVILLLRAVLCIIDEPAMGVDSIGVVTLLLLTMKLFILPKGPDDDPIFELWTDGMS